MKTIRRRLTVIAALSVASLMVSACSGSGSKDSGGSTLRVGVVDQFLHPNPFNASSIIDYSYQQMTLPALVQYDGKGEIVPDLATSWTTSEDGLTWTFKLVPGAKWSDGAPLTSKDVAFTFNTIIKYVDGPTAIDSQNITNLDSVSTTDPETAVFHYRAPMAAALAYLNNTSILPEHVWGKLATGDGAGLKTYPNKAPSVAGGPFTPTSWDGSSFLALKRNPNFYGKKPAYSKMGIKYYTSPDGLIQDLKRGKVDFANAVPLSSADLLKNSGLQIDVRESTNYLDLFFNMKAPRNKTLGNVELRHLMNRAVDRDRIIEIAYPGSKPGASIVTPTATFWNPDVKTPAFDVAGVNTALDAAGYKSGSGGIRERGGVKLTYSVLINGSLSGAGDRTFQILSDDFKKVGIELVGRKMDSSAYRSALFGKDNNYEGWDMALGMDSALLDPGYDLSYFTCGSFGAYNFSGWCDKHFDKLYLKQAALTKPEERKPVVYEMQEYADKVLPAITILYTATIDAYQKSWTGFGAGPFGSLSPLSKVTMTEAHKK